MRNLPFYIIYLWIDFEGLNKSLTWQMWICLISKGLLIIFLVTGINLSKKFSQNLALCKDNLESVLHTHLKKGKINGLLRNKTAPNFLKQMFWVI